MLIVVVLRERVAAGPYFLSFHNVVIVESHLLLILIGGFRRHWFRSGP